MANFREILEENTIFNEHPVCIRDVCQIPEDFAILTIYVKRKLEKVCPEGGGNHAKGGKLFVRASRAQAQIILPPPCPISVLRLCNVHAFEIFHCQYRFLCFLDYNEKLIFVSKKIELKTDGMQSYKILFSN